MKHVSFRQIKLKYSRLHRDRIAKLMELQSDRAVLNYLARYNVDTDNILKDAAPADVNLGLVCGLRPFDPHAELGRTKSLLAELRMAYEGVAVIVSLGNPGYVPSCMPKPIRKMTALVYIS